MKSMEWDRSVWNALKDAVSGMPPVVRGKALKKIIEKAEERAKLRGLNVVSDSDLAFAVEICVPPVVKSMCKSALRDNGVDVDSILPPFMDTIARIDSITTGGGDRDRVLSTCIDILKSSFGTFDWVGIYFVDGDNLVLGPYDGEPTEHTVIPVSEGICGAAVREGGTILVDDVRADERYIACSFSSRSEIVVPIFKDGVPVAEIDIDSNTPSAFKEEDRLFLEEVARLLSRLF